MTSRLSHTLRAAACLAIVAAAPALAQKGVPPTSVTVGGKPMVSDRSLWDNLTQSADHTVFVSLLQQAGMADALQGHGPFTVFAPTDQAFAALPAGDVQDLRKPDNKAELAALLSLQVVQGNYSLARFRYLLRVEKNQVALDTISDSKVTVTTNGPANLVLRDAKGENAAVTLYDVKSANGVIYVTDRVLRPS